MLIWGIGSAIFGVGLGSFYGIIGIPLRTGGFLPPNPILGFAIGVLGGSAGLVALYYGLRKPAKGGTTS